MDVEPPPDAAFAREWLGKIKEVVDRHRPDLVWLDNRMHALDEEYRLAMAAHYYNGADADDQPVVLTYKHEDMPPGTAVLDLERNRMPGIHPEPWLTDTSIARNSWSYTPALDYYSTDRIVHDLVDIVSKTLRAGRGEVREAHLLGHDAPLEWKQTGEGLDVALPDGIRRPHALALRISGSGLDP